MRKRVLVMAAAVALLAAPGGVSAVRDMPDDDNGGGGGWVSAGSACHNPGWKCPCLIPSTPGQPGRIGTCQCTRVKMPWGYENVWLPV